MITKSDFKLIGYHLGRVTLGVGLMMLVPAFTAVLFREWAIFLDFITSISICVILSHVTRNLFYSEEELKFKHAMSIAAFAWILGSMLGALPLWLSGSMNSYLDGVFDAMSGWTTCGLTLVPDIDHLPYSINFWRHFMQFIGGAGIVVFALAVVTRRGRGAVRLYLAEGREERIFPSMTTTSRIILSISVLYLIIGSIIQFFAGMYAGMPLKYALYDAVCYTMAAFSTGGFAPHSQSVLFYHSTVYEIVTIIIFVIGAFNFALHFAVLNGNRKEVYKNIEIITFSTTVIVLTIVTTSWLLHYGIYSDYVTLFRKGFYQFISGHTTTGFSTIYPIQMSKEWPNLPEFAVTIAMLLGACACSTGGGVKALRVGITSKLFSREVKKIIYPETAVVVEKYHHLTNTPLRDDYARGALLVIVGYIILFAFGTMITMFFGYNAVDSMFESASAVGNTGLSSGITSYTMPVVIKVTYIFLMWAGRLEILSVFVLLGVVYSAMRRVHYM